MKVIVSERVSDRSRVADWKLRRPLPPRIREKGATAIMFAGFIVVIIGFFGLALDMSRIHNRKAEMQVVADTAAISAAKKLNGESTGLSAALAAARQVVEGGGLQRPKYAYTQTMDFSDAAIMFSKSAGGSAGWLDATSAQASPSGLAYVKVDTSQLHPSYGTVNMMFMPALSSLLSLPSKPTVRVSHTAVAGRAGIGVTPIAICAMSTTRAEQRQNPGGNDELVEHGFRRGVSYDLMNLSSYQDAATNFLVDPISPPGASSSGSNFDLSTVGPYVCTGTVALPSVMGASIRVKSDFPIADLYHHLNSRFNLSNGRCNSNTALPDLSIRQFAAANIAWMTPRPIYQSARAEAAFDNKLRTIADLPPPNDQPTPTHYGPLWVFARAVPWSSYVAGKPEPANGYTPFAATTAIWTSLYSTGPGLSGYPSPTGVATPYSTSPLPPPIDRPGISQRRVLKVPLVQCPVSGSTATVLAIGKFFMTVPADSSSIPAEFAGIAADEPVAGQVELHK